MISEEKEIIIHIGMPKAASTSLQNNFFKRLPLINYTGGLGDTISSKAFSKVIHTEDMYFHTDEIRREMLHNVDEKLPILFSQEFACSPFLPLSRGIPQSRVTIANRFKTLFPDAKILIIIRNQLKLQQSLYSEYYKHESRFIKTGSLTFKKWMALNIEQLKGGRQNVFHFADFNSLIKIYQNLFKDVKVVVFEEMIKDMNGFIEDELCPFIGVDKTEAIQYFIDKVENRRHSKGGVFADNSVRRIINILQNNLGNPQKAISIEKRKSFMKKVHEITDSISLGKMNTEYTSEHKKVLNEFYAEGNRKVSEMLDVDLGKYGYPM